jgi:hypothetical protein
VRRRRWSMRMVDARMPLKMVDLLFNTAIMLSSPTFSVALPKSNTLGKVPRNSQAPMDKLLVDDRTKA